MPGATPTQHAIYRNDDVIRTGHVCGNDAGQPGALAPGGIDGADDVGGTVQTFAAAKVAELACDADYDYFLDFGSDVPTVENQIMSIVNAMNIQYERDVGITHQLTATIVRTDENDPYTAKKSRRRLNEMQAEWNANQSGIVRDTAQLFTGITLAGNTIGEAFDFGVICDVPRSYSIVANFNNNLACLSDLTAHELGHCWDARHCSCSNYTMNGSITCTIDACNAGNCSNTPINCDDNDPCTADSCDGSGNCVNDPIPNCGGGVSVECITYTVSGGGPNKDKNLDIAVQVVDASGNPVSSAAVSISLTFPSGGVGTGTTTTDG